MIVSGADGRRISWLDDDGSGARVLSPRWIPDVSGDRIADVLLTISGIVTNNHHCLY